MPKSKVRKKAQEKVNRERQDKRAGKGVCADSCCPPPQPRPRLANDDQ